MNFYESWRDKGKFLDKPSSRGEERWSNCNYFPGCAQHLPPSPACIALKDSHKINHTRDSAIITVIISKWKLLTSEIKQLMLDLNYTTINQSKQQHFLVCKITSNRGQLWQFLCEYERLTITKMDGVLQVVTENIVTYSWHSWQWQIDS